MRATSMSNQIFHFGPPLQRAHTRLRPLGTGQVRLLLIYMLARVCFCVCLGELPARGDKLSVLKNRRKIRSRSDGLLVKVASSKLWIKFILICHFWQ